MKTYKLYLVLSISIITTFFGCNDAIDIDQPGRLDAENAFRTVDDLNSGLLSLYDDLDTTAEIALASNFTDEISIGAGTGGQGFAVYDFVLNAASAGAENFWERNYRVNNRATVLIESANVVDVASEDVSRFNNIIAQARAIRAYANLEMLTYFSTNPADDAALAVPVIDFVPSNVTIQPLRNTVGELWDYINNDLIEAESLINNESSVVFISKDAVKALRARAALVREDFTTALSLATDLYNKYPLASKDNYIDMFLDNSAGEVIFKLERTRNDNHDGQVSTGSIDTRRFTADTDANPYAGWVGSVYTFESIQAAGYFEMDRSLYNAFEPNDVRLEVNVSPASSIDPDYMDNPDASFGTDQIIISKYPGSEAQPLMNDLKVFRSSEMLFIMAEAQVRLNNNLSAAANLLKELRDIRLGADTPLLSFNSAQEALGAILDEKRLEFAFEGHRYRDLKRIGTLANRGVDRDETDCNRQSGACTLPASDFRFTLPIPISEINANPPIGEQQNPGYN